MSFLNEVTTPIHELPHDTEISPLCEHVGETIEAELTFPGGHVTVCGRIKYVHGGQGCGDRLWVGPLCLPVDIEGRVRRYAAGQLVVLRVE